MITIFGQDAKASETGDLFIAKKGSVEGRTKVTLYNIKKDIALEKNQLKDILMSIIRNSTLPKEEKVDLGQELADEILDTALGMEGLGH